MIKLPYFADPKNLVVDEERPERPDDGPEGKSSLELLQTIYRDRTLPLNVRVRCAIEALAFENPKLSATAVTRMDGKSFAEQLERAIERSQKPLPPPKLIEQHPASELSGPMSRLVRRF
jgi:hypothetical protein